MMVLRIASIKDVYLAAWSSSVNNLYEREASEWPRQWNLFKRATADFTSRPLDGSLILAPLQDADHRRRRHPPPPRRNKEARLRLLTLSHFTHLRPRLISLLTPRARRGS